MSMLANLTRILVFLLTLLLLTISISLVAVFLQTYREYQAFKVRESEYVARLEQTRKDLSAKEEYLRLILTDSRFLERVVREKLGYARPDETIFHFEETHR